MQKKSLIIYLRARASTNKGDVGGNTGRGVTGGGQVPDLYRQQVTQCLDCVHGTGPFPP